MAAVAAGRLGGRVGVGEGVTVPVVEVGADLEVVVATWRVARVGERRWWFVPAADGVPLLVEPDDAGLPRSFATGESWPLELEDLGPTG